MSKWNKWLDNKEWRGILVLRTETKGKQMNITINKYIEMLTKLAQDHPDAILIYASDDEGNSYDRVRHAPF